jgi:hypothetical protein
VLRAFTLLRRKWMRHGIALLSMMLLWLAAPLHAQAVLNANADPSNNGGSAGSAIFFDLEATTGVVITGLTTASVATPGDTFTLRVRTRAGTALGGPVETGPGSSDVGWTVLGTVTATQGSGEISLPIGIPELPIAAGQVVGVAVEFLDTGPRYFGVGTAALETYTNANLIIRTGDARSAPFTPAGNFFSSRALVGSIRYRLADAVLPANPGPGNNSGAINSGLFFDLQSPTGAVVTGLTTGNQGSVNGNFQIEVYTRNGTALGNTSLSGPATSSAGWTSHGTVAARAAPGATSLPIALPPLNVAPGQTLGVGLRFLDAGPRYFGTGTSTLENYVSPDLSLVTGQALATPFATGGSVFTSRALVGAISWRPPGQQLPAHPGPNNNGGNIGFGMFMDLHAETDIVVTGLNTATTAAPNTDFLLQVYTLIGSTLGGTPSGGPTSTTAGWFLHAAVDGRQGPTGELSLPIAIPDLPISAGQTMGIALVFVDTSPNYVGSGSSPPTTYRNANLRLTTGEVKSDPFTPGGNFFASRELLGNIFYRAETTFRDGFE